MMGDGGSGRGGGLDVRGCRFEPLAPPDPVEVAFSGLAAYMAAFLTGG